VTAAVARDPNHGGTEAGGGMKNQIILMKSLNLSVARFGSPCQGTTEQKPLRATATGDLKMKSQKKFRQVSLAALPRPINRSGYQTLLEYPTFANLSVFKNA
jgi:hypothetical protein